jgi:hypothetical protein
MKIYVLIIVCLYTIIGFVKLVKAIMEDNGELAIAAIINIVLGVLAIIFQSINL